MPQIFKIILFSILFTALQGKAQTPGTDVCAITKTEWSTQDELNYQEFVVNIGEAVEQGQCHKVDQCMRQAANPFKNSDPSGLHFNNDCAKLSPMLRAYFACKNGLPFSVANGIKARNVKNNGGNLRYNRYGNVVSSRHDFTTPAEGAFPSFVKMLNQTVPDGIYSANYRFHYEVIDEPLFTDFYPVAINREAIRPGTIIYDPNGHVVTVFRVEQDGRIKYVDSHPDNSLTTGYYGKQFVRSNPGMGAGFKNWRPLKLVGATKNEQGFYIGGHIETLKSTEIPDFSIEQFVGNVPSEDGKWQNGKFFINGEEIKDYYDYTRMKLSVGDLKLEPRREMTQMVQNLCATLQDRVMAVDGAISAGINNKTHPARLPENIYGTSGEWEVYSTPSRDARLKVSFVDLLDQTKKFFELQAQGNPMLDYTGSNLAQDLLDIYLSEARACQITYTNSVGQAVTLDFEQVRERLFKLSFDPYHCVELRWGASSDSELATCADGSNKRLWYEREQYLRNQIERRYEDRMDFNLEELAKLQPGNGVAEAPETNLIDFLNKKL